MAYNLLAPSLGSNAIPWVMTVSPQHQAAAAAAFSAASGSPQTWPAIASALTAEYKAHWHKNLRTSPFLAMRQLWSTSTLDSPADLPHGLEGVTVVAPHTVQFVSASGAVATATTLRGTLTALLGDAAGQTLFDHIMATEAEVFAWPVRGQRVVARITQAYGGLPPPDVVTLAEYEGHDVPSTYRDGHGEETFPQAMAALGYDGVFFHGPDPDRKPPAGLATYWRRDVFALQCESGSVPEELSGEGGGALRLPCRERRPGVPAMSIDLNERRHLAADAADATLLPAAKRKNGSIVRLVHKASGKALWVVSLHAMTRSLDSAASGRWTGEVRMRELATLRATVAEWVPQSEVLLVMGDFNTDVTNMDVLSGHAVDAKGEELRVDTGFDPITKLLHWNHASCEPLTEAFAPLHKWQPADVSGVCTSLNTVRCEWIDYMWHSPSQLQVIARSDAALAVPPVAIPTATEGSDHLAVAAQLQFVPSAL